jgi:hypothetical protein
MYNTQPDKNEIGNAGAIDLANSIQQIEHIAILSLGTILMETQTKLAMKAL